ncbi:MAG: thiosulfate oxidation carrier complex protein SoxZ [Betaproteobacteria bacterium HGW-Betaproteobacteria-20]|nr:MAG: thiosulfate oxidation carrier complex protein SoxZ [Betaproteobacteria bacterium HGW-Betaproteobacteria-20]
MVANMKLRARLKADAASGAVTEVKLLISHVMETGRRKDDLNQLIPAHFIQLLTATLNGKPVLEAQWGTGVAKNPYLTFHVKGAKLGDIINVTWHDNLGQTESAEVAVVQELTP